MYIAKSIKFHFFLMSNRKQHSIANKPLNSKFVAGFADAESCYLVSVTRNIANGLKWVVSAKFQFCLHLDDLPLLESIQEFCGGIGYIHKDTKNNKVSYVVTKISDLHNIIIPFFYKYPLLTQKRLDFIL